MHDFDPVTKICKKCGLSKSRLHWLPEWAGLSCAGKEVDEEEFVRQTAEVEPDAIVNVDRVGSPGR
jgi:hypothetical protein